MSKIPPCESEIVEFKRNWTENIKKELVAFANTLGGDLYIGVGDAGEIVGVDQPDRTAERVISMARDNIYPSVMPLLSFKRIREGDKTVVAVHVMPGTDKPYCTDPSDIGTIYVRVGTFSMTASYAQVSRFVAQANPVVWESRVATEQALTFEFCRAFALSKNLNFNPTQDFFYGFVDPKSRSYTNLAYLCSDENPHKIVIAVFADEEKAQLLKSETLSGSILKCLQDAQEFILGECLLRMEKPTDGSLERQNRYSVPPDAVREALVNMVAHRDYTRTPPCVIHLTPSRVLFFSVGGPADLTEEEILLQIATNCRNVRLANFLKALHLMKGTGSGFCTIRSAYNNIPLRQLIQVLDTSFLISLPRQILPVEVRRFPTYADVMALDSQTSVEARIIDLIRKNGPLTRAQIEEQLTIPRTTANYWLNKLNEKQQIIREGSGRNTRYVARMS